VTLADLIREAERILVFTGAGISTNSGIPDYRGPSGRWKVRDPVYYRDFMTSEAARIEYWDQKSEGWEQLRDAEPNDVHRAVVEIEKAGRLLLLVTQNIDGLHEKAGTSRTCLIELHGNTTRVACQTCSRERDADGCFAEFRDTRKPPQCSCGGWLKPATISFGQSLVKADLDRAMVAATRCDLCIAMGSTLSVHPAASIPVIAVDQGARYAIVNRGVTDHDGLEGLTLRLEGDVGALFPSAVTEALRT
jgi:NAD-dependent deacetylase